MSRILFDSNGLPFADGEAYYGQLLSLEDTLFLPAVTTPDSSDWDSRLLSTSAVVTGAQHQLSTTDHDAHLLPTDSDAVGGLHRTSIATYSGALIELE